MHLLLQTTLITALCSSSVHAFTTISPAVQKSTRSSAQQGNNSNTYVRTTSLSASSDESSDESSEEKYLDNLKTNWEGDNSKSDDEKSDYLNNLKKPSWEDDQEDESTTAIDEKSKLIQSLLINASSSDRGQFASTAQKSKMDDIIAKLESLNDGQGTTNPTESSSIEGTWELLYSSTQLFRSSPFFMAGRAVCQTDEEAQQYDWFCDMHRAALAISEIGKVRQVISSDRMVSEFEVSVGAVPFLSDFTPFAYSGGLPFTIEGAIVSSADITPTSNGNAWEIFMDTVEIKGSNIPLLRKALDEGLKLQSRGLGDFLESNIPSYSNPKPVFETTYLDDILRISRDQDGKVFVYGKLSDETEPTNYDDVEADFGVLKLLEGLNDSIFRFSI